MQPPLIHLFLGNTPYPFSADIICARPLRPPILPFNLLRIHLLSGEKTEEEFEGPHMRRPLNLDGFDPSTASLCHLRTMLPESSSCPQPAQQPNHAT